MLDSGRLMSLVQARQGSDLRSAEDLLIGLVLILQEPAAYQFSKINPPDAVRSIIDYVLMDLTNNIDEFSHPSISERLNISFNNNHFRLVPELTPKDERPEYKYDVCVSFSGSERGIAEEFSKKLQDSGARVFYDDFRKDDVFGQDLVNFLFRIYREESRYCVTFFSKEYLKRRWTQHELRAAMLRLVEQGSGYILPVLVDDDACPPELEGVSHWSYHPQKLDDLVEAVWKRVNSTKYSDWLDMYEVGAVLNRDQKIESIFGGFRDIVDKASEKEARMALACLGLICGTMFWVSPTMKKIYEYICFRNPAVANLFSDAGEFSIESMGPVLKRETGRDGPLLIKNSFIEFLAEKDGWINYPEKPEDDIEEQTVEDPDESPEG